MLDLNRQYWQFLLVGGYAWLLLAEPVHFVLKLLLIVGVLLCWSLKKVSWRPQTEVVFLLLAMFHPLGVVYGLMRQSELYLEVMPISYWTMSIFGVMCLGIWFVGRGENKWKLRDGMIFGLLLLIGYTKQISGTGIGQGIYYLLSIAMAVFVADAWELGVRNRLLEAGVLLIVSMMVLFDRVANVALYV